jgi:hypothetical protein
MSKKLIALGVTAVCIGSYVAGSYAKESVEPQDKVATTCKEVKQFEIAKLKFLLPDCSTPDELKIITIPSEYLTFCWSTPILESTF